MADYFDGTSDRDWKINDILDVDNFIVQYDADRLFEKTRVEHYKNYFSHLLRLYSYRQILVQRKDGDQIVGVCGWIRIFPQDEHDINKVRWTYPQNISDGNILYVTFCVVKPGEGNLLGFRRRLKELIGYKVDEAWWFNMPENRFFRKKIVREEKVKCQK